MAPGIGGREVPTAARHVSLKRREPRRSCVLGGCARDDRRCARRGRVVNEADLDHYIAKPWDDEAPQAIVREQLAEYASRWVDDLLPYVPVLNGPRLMSIIAERGFDR